MKKIAVRVVAVVVIVWLCASAAIYKAMLQPPEAFARVMSHIPGPVAFLALPFEMLWSRARAGALAKGDTAPDFTLSKLDKSGAIQLSSFTAQHRPVALIFGSYT
jgi:hypothetical protein